MFAHNQIGPDHLDSDQIAALTAAIARTEQRHPSLTIRWIKTSNELNRELDAGLARLYADIFGGWPYYEIFTEAEAKQEWHEILGKDGLIFTASTADRLDQPIAFIASVPLANEHSVLQLLTHRNIPIDDADKMFWLTEHGVSEKNRGRGIGNVMKRLAFDTNIACGFDGGAFLRTNHNNYLQLSVMFSSGAELLPVTQHIEWLHSRDDIPNIDLRYYLKLSAEAIYGQGCSDQHLSQVVIARLEPGDTVIVYNSSVPRDQQSTMINYIQYSFPGIRQVIFAEHEKLTAVTAEIVFKGKLHLPKPLGQQPVLREDAKAAPEVGF